MSIYSNALRYIQETCTELDITPPNEIFIDAGRIRLGVGRKEREGSPVYWANIIDSNNVKVTISTFKHSMVPITKIISIDKEESGILSDSERSLIASKIADSLIAKKEGEKNETIRKADMARKVLIKYIEADTKWDVNKHIKYFSDSVFSTGENTVNNLQNIIDGVNDNLGIRYTKNEIIIPIVDVLTGIGIGFQVIYSTDNKTYTKKIYGSVKGGGVIIGNLENGLNFKNSKKETFEQNSVVIVEGVRTGLGSFVIGGGNFPVVCALSSLFLEEIAKKLYSFEKVIQHEKNQTHLKFTNIGIAADNDDKKDSLYYTNSGLVNANKVAAKYNLWITAPQETGDWWDVLRDHGLEKSITEFQNYSEVDYTYIFKKKPTKEEQNEGSGARYLEDLTLKPGVNLIKSPTGTGKTMSLKKFTKDPNLSVLYTTLYQSLATTEAGNLGLDLYTDTNINVRNSSKLSICLNSLHKLFLSESVLQTKDVFIVDEIESTLRRLTTEFDDKHVNLEVLTYFVKHSKYVAFLDAFLGPLTKKWLKSLDIEIANEIENPYKIGNGRCVIPYKKKDLLIDATIKEIQNGGNVAIHCNSRRESNNIFGFINEKVECKGLCITSANNGDQEVIDFFMNPNEEAAKYQLLIFSPSLNTGVSIDSKKLEDGTIKPAFSFVGVIANNKITTHTDILQAAARVRDAKEIHLWVEPTTCEIRTDAQISARWEQAKIEYDTYLKNHLCINEYGQAVIDKRNKWYKELKLNVLKYNNLSHSKWKYNIFKSFSAMGYTFKPEINNPRNLWKQEDPKTFIKSGEVREVGDQIYTANIIEAVVLSVPEVIKLKKQHHHTGKETDDLTKTQLYNFYKEKDLPDEELADLIKFDNRGRMQKAILNIELGLMTEEEIIDSLHSKKTMSSMEADIIPQMAKSNYFRGLTMLADRLSKIEEYNADTPEVKGFIGYITKMKDTIELNSTANIPKNIVPIKFLNEQLARIGLVSKSHRKGAKNNRERFYKLDPSALENLKRILLLRKPENADMINKVLV